METSDILKIIYEYYPRDLDWNDITSIVNSEEYQKRAKKCEIAREESANWQQFKKELNDYAKSKFNDRLYDYSILGNQPCYHATIRLGNSVNKVISVLVSVIIPLWSYRIMEYYDPFVTRYSCYSEDENDTLLFIEEIIDKYFPSYRLIGEKQHQIIVPDIATAYTIGPNIFEAIFTENEN